ncbi:hypothetical protein HPB47_014787 [Ixodes persulcatus]|uniref:Uncharacterized protein n=1 Tax=Ixodes persulcatus TaxID=34615 RepID=A0AC60QX00_IXOPE|nr:hypothetical protein HPB47_014787 [Ixodes persulcatus]
MKAQKRFAKMVFYMKACSSGSMFQDLAPDDINVYVMACANSDKCYSTCHYDEYREASTGNLFRILKGENGAQLNATKLWVVLVAGPPRWDNYRYQASVCHARQMLHSHGVQDERIVVLMFDDIAYSANNPTPGANRRTTRTSCMVSAETFFNVLRGQKPTYGSGKVVASEPDDQVFVYFVGEGQKYRIQFPDDAIYAHDLVNFLVELKAHRKFSKMVFYLDTCNSGSMFEFLLPEDSDVYALTAINSDGVSSACYLNPGRLTSRVTA